MKWYGKFGRFAREEGSRLRALRLEYLSFRREAAIPTFLTGRTLQYFVHARGAARHSGKIRLVDGGPRWGFAQPLEVSAHARARIGEVRQRWFILEPDSGVFNVWVTKTCQFLVWPHCRHHAL